MDRWSLRSRKPYEIKTRAMITAALHEFNVAYENHKVFEQQNHINLMFLVKFWILEILGKTQSFTMKSINLLKNHNKILWNLKNLPTRDYGRCSTSISYYIPTLVKPFVRASFFMCSDKRNQHFSMRFVFLALNQVIKTSSWQKTQINQNNLQSC
jgi:hypothetical protein